MLIIDKYIFYLLIVDISNIYPSRKNIIVTPHEFLAQLPQFSSTQ